MTKYRQDLETSTMFGSFVSKTWRWVSLWRPLSDLCRLVQKQTIVSGRIIKPIKSSKHQAARERQRLRSCLQLGPPMCHTTHLCHAEGGSDPLSRSPHYYSLAETDSTRLSVCSESFGLRKCIIGAGCQADGTIRPQIKEFAAATITCLSCDKTHARPACQYIIKSIVETQIVPNSNPSGQIYRERNRLSLSRWWNQQSHSYCSYIIFFATKLIPISTFACDHKENTYNIFILNISYILYIDELEH